VAEIPSQKDITISMILRHMHESNAFLKQTQGLHKCEPIPLFIREKQLFRNALEVVEKIITSDERKKLTAEYGGIEDRERTTLYMDLQERVLDKTWEYEGCDPTLERKKQKKKPGTDKRATYQGIGKRIRTYKDLIYERQNPDPSKRNKNLVQLVELVERKDLPEPGTPKGHRSVASYFTSHNKSTNN
jgi:hypothetical protein